MSGASRRFSASFRNMVRPRNSPDGHARASNDGAYGARRRGKLKLSCRDADECLYRIALLIGLVEGDSSRRRLLCPPPPCREIWDETFFVVLIWCKRIFPCAVPSVLQKESVSSFARICLMLLTTPSSPTPLRRLGAGYSVSTGTIANSQVGGGAFDLNSIFNAGGPRAAQISLKPGF
jgi:hypothetical protein